MSLFDDVDPWKSSIEGSSFGRSTNVSTDVLCNSFNNFNIHATPLPNVDTNILEGSIWDDGIGRLSATSSSKNHPLQDTLVGDEEQRQEQSKTDKTTTDEQAQIETDDWLKSVRKTFNPLSLDIIFIEEMPEREGVLFKHTNYLIKCSIDLKSSFQAPISNDSEVIKNIIRRYSDFVWLQEVLIKIYPFRMVPELPPKKIGSQISDAAFMERRKRGLTRFLNFVMKHPVLKNDKIVLTFLTVTTDINSWKKQGDLEITDELSGKELSPNFKKIWRKEFSEHWNAADSSIEHSINIWTRIGIMIERYEKRLKQIAQERSMLSSFISDLTEVTPKLYPIEHSDSILDINNHFSIINNHLNTMVEISHQETSEYSRLLVPKFKKFVDILISLKELFERYRIVGGNNIAQLYRHVESNAAKLETMKGNPDTRGAEYDRIRVTISRDKRSIIEQSNKAWLIRECILEEFVIFQETQYLISTSFQEWAKINSNHSGLNMNEWEKLMDQLVDMPTFNRS